MCTNTCLKWKQTEMDKRTERNDIQSFKQFLNGFIENLKEKSDDEDPIPLRFHNPHVTPDELEGECLDWVLNYLSTRGCPSVLAARIAREVYVQVSRSDLDSFLYETNSDETKTLEDEDTAKEISEETPNELVNKEILIEYNAEELQKYVLENVESVCKSWSETLPDLFVANTYHRVSFNAIKNTRRKMEDTHVIAPDLNALFGLKDEPMMSFYGVFDGHAGTDASLFTSKHIHRNLVHYGCLDKNPAEALRSAFRVTDEQFIPKAKREKWRSGTTGVTALIRDNTAYLSWLGDSQAVLVKDGRCVTHMDPHKPEREDERERIESQGGFVMLVGDLWRVGGNIAVSRAIETKFIIRATFDSWSATILELDMSEIVLFGDVAYKPYISSEAEVTCVDLDGTEDYMVLACDGLWDVVTEEDLPKLVYNFLIEADGDHSTIAKSLVQYAKDNDSTDNISVVVVFFRENISEPKSDTGLFNFLLGDSTQGDGKPRKSKDEKGDKSKESDGTGGKGDKSVNENGSENESTQDSYQSLDGIDTNTEPQDDSGREPKQGETSMNFDLEETQDQGCAENESDLSKSVEIDDKNMAVEKLQSLNAPTLEAGGTVYMQIGHILGLESPESMEFVKNVNNRLRPDLETDNNFMPDYEELPIEKEVDLDYYGVFNTRLVDGPIDLSTFDDQNSSILLKDIADTMYNCKYEQISDNDDILPGTEDKKRDRKGPPHQRTSYDYSTGKQKKEPVKGAQRNKKGFSNSPICWAFTGKNKATVQNHRLNLAARGSIKGSNLTPGELTLAAKAPHHLPDRKFAQLTGSKENVLNTCSNVNNLTFPKRDSIQTHPKSKSKKITDTRPGFTVFGSKTNLQTETQKFHTSWRPRKPLKPLTTTVYEMPPTPFTNKPLNSNQKTLK